MILEICSEPELKIFFYQSGVFPQHFIVTGGLTLKPQQVRAQHLLVKHSSLD